MTTSTANDWARDVADALARLNRRRATLIAAVYFRGATQADLAERTGLSRADVAREISHGMQELGGALRG